MIAEYKGKKYKIVKNRKGLELISKKTKDDGFLKDGDIFYKTISDLKILDAVYDIWIVVEYLSN